MIRAVGAGSTKRTEAYLDSIRPQKLFRDLDKFGRRGVDALRGATPVDTGDTRNSWSYEIEQTGSSISITWLNRDDTGGVSIVMLLQYGHGTGTGGYVAGRDFINPAIQPIFDQILDEVWKKVNHG